MAAVRRRAGSAAATAARVRIARVYDVPDAGSSTSGSSTPRVLVDRLWPRGVSKAGAPFDSWLKDVAPSAPLRVWYAHVPDRFEEFAGRYRAELEQQPAASALADLRAKVASSGVVLLTATKDVEHSGAAVLRDVLLGG